MDSPTYLSPKEAKGVVSIAVHEAAFEQQRGVMVIANGQKVLLNRYQAKALVTKLTIHLAKTSDQERSPE